VASDGGMASVATIVQIIEARLALDMDSDMEAEQEL